MSQSSTKTTTDHDEIRRWVEEHDGRPGTVKATEEGGEPGVLRIDFPGGDDDRLEDISWDDFFVKFEEEELALLYQEQKADGSDSTFAKFVSR
jgi:hypothetical protein